MTAESVGRCRRLGAIGGGACIPHRMCFTSTVRWGKMGPDQVVGRAGSAKLESVTSEVGAALRRARISRGLTLREAAHDAPEELKPTTLASYERGERAVSVDRLFRLSLMYGISPARLIADVLRRVEGRSPVQIDVRKVRSLGGAEAGILDGFVRNVLMLRDQPTSDTITLREGDLDVLATATGRRVQDFVEAIGPALMAE
jgi:transcriptional regulator with XRE-family HTH domain